MESKSLMEYLKEGCHKEYKRYKYHVISLLNRLSN
jgi:hypothetical protein